MTLVTCPDCTTPYDDAIHAHCPRCLPVKTMQRFGRGWQARRSLHRDFDASVIVRPMPHPSLEPAMFFGNDPDFQNELKEIIRFVGPGETYNIVGTSCLYVLNIAYMVSVVTGNIPTRIFLIDYSKEVFAFWTQVKGFAKDSSKFMKFLTSFADRARQAFSQAPAGAFNADKPVKYIEQLIRRVEAGTNLDLFCQVVTRVTPVLQDWGHTPTFDAIRCTVVREGLGRTIAYPSNIVACILWGQLHQKLKSIEHVIDQKYKLILTNIDRLQPFITIHTNLSLSNTWRGPDRTIILRPGESMSGFLKGLIVHDNPALMEAMQYFLAEDLSSWGS